MHNSEKSVSFINQGEISQYLKEVRKLKVMTPKREKEIAKMMLSNDLTDSEKESIKNEIILGNLRFVISVCKEYQNQGIDLADLISEGNYGLMKAFENFNWSKNIRFISYGRWWIKQAVLETLNKNSRTIRLPVNVIQEYYKIKKKLDGLNEAMSDKFENLPKSVGLETQINEDGSTMIDVIAGVDDNFSDVDSKKKLNNKLHDILSILDDREKLIIERYFGIGCEAENLETIGFEIGLTKERVRQIKEKAIRKLRNETLELFDFI